MTRSDLEGFGRLVLVTSLGVGLVAPAWAGSADDDLQAVRKAVLASSRPQPRVKGEPMWFRLRIVEKAGKRGRVSLNLPIGLVRSLGDDWPIPGYQGCRKRDHCGVTLGELLRSLDSGQPLVDIEDDEATVRVWVE